MYATRLRSCEFIFVDHPIISSIQNMEKKHKRLGQYINENHDYSGTSGEFFEETAPLIGYIVHSFNLIDGQLNSSICNLINERADEMAQL
jgi:hypothetical protein